METPQRTGSSRKTRYQGHPSHGLSDRIISGVVPAGTGLAVSGNRTHKLD